MTMKPNRGKFTAHITLSNKDNCDDCPCFSEHSITCKLLNTEIYGSENEYDIFVRRRPNECPLVTIEDDVVKFCCDCIYSCTNCTLTGKDRQCDLNCKNITSKAACTSCVGLSNWEDRR